MPLSNLSLRGAHTHIHTYKAKPPAEQPTHTHTNTTIKPPRLAFSIRTKDHPNNREDGRPGWRPESTSVCARARVCVQYLISPLSWCLRYAKIVCNPGVCIIAQPQFRYGATRQHLPPATTRIIRSCRRCPPSTPSSAPPSPSPLAVFPTANRIYV